MQMIGTVIDYILAKGVLKTPLKPITSIQTTHPVSVTVLVSNLLGTNLPRPCVCFIAL
jgi:hypothetical protein